MYLLATLRSLVTLLVVIVLINILGCNSETADSEDINTSGIWAKIEVNAQDDGRSRVVVELNVGGAFGTNVVLSNNEYLEVTAAGVTKTMVEDTDFLDVDYQAYMDTTASDTEFNIRFYRNNGENIVNSRATLPDAFEITAPSTNTIYGLSNVVALVWTPEVQDAMIQLSSTVSCTTSNGATTTSSQSQYINDTGMYEYDISLFNMFANGTTGLNTAQPCSMSFTLIREAFGNIDSEFDEGGTFRTLQTRKLDNLRLNLN